MSPHEVTRVYASPDVTWTGPILPGRARSCRGGPKVAMVVACTGPPSLPRCREAHLQVPKKGIYGISKTCGTRPDFRAALVTSKFVAWRGRKLGLLRLLACPQKGHEMTRKSSSFPAGESTGFEGLRGALLKKDPNIHTRYLRPLLIFFPGGKVQKILAHSFETRFKSRIAMV